MLPYSSRILPIKRELLRKGATTFSITTLGIMAPSEMTLGVTNLTTLCIFIHSILKLASENDSQRNENKHKKHLA
jgi:hypothetical protein